VIIRKYVPDDYKKINRRNWDKISEARFPDKDVVAINLSRGYAYTMVCDEGIVACGGIIPLWKGVGEAWAITSELLNMYRLSFAKAARKLVDTAIKELELERIQAVVIEGHKDSIKWVEWIGFEEEGLMRRYIDGRNYALIKDKGDS